MLLSASSAPQSQQFFIRNCKNDENDELPHDVLDAIADGEAAGPPEAHQAPEPVGPHVPAPVACPLDGWGHLKVHFDRHTHASGRQRAFLKCHHDAHQGDIECRRYVFVDDYATKAEAAAFLLAWGLSAELYSTRLEHIAGKPYPEDVAWMLSNGVEVPDDT